MQQTFNEVPHQVIYLVDGVHSIQCLRSFCFTRSLIHYITSVYSIAQEIRFKREMQSAL